MIDDTQKMFETWIKPFTQVLQANPWMANLNQSLGQMNPAFSTNQLNQASKSNQFNQASLANPHAAMGMASSLQKMLQEMGAELNSSQWQQLQTDYFAELSQLWQDMLSQKTIELKDRRFSSPAWTKSPHFSYQAASYLINARFLNKMAQAVDAPAKKKMQLQFYINQMIDAMSPANFLASNPEAQASLLESKGESLMHGMQHMLADMQKGRISLTDETAFHVGENVATTEGAVVYQNNLFQLIQYKSLTKTVYQKPLLIVPPCINKYYILDLQAENSLVRYAIEQGFTVFLMSWVNPTEEHDEVTWDEYVEQGPIQAIEVVQEITKQKQINCLGFCVGGTLLSTSLAVLADRGVHPAASLTLLTTLLDFADTGVLDVFVDEMQVSLRESSIGKKGLLPARDLASTFSSLRPNDLVWNYVQSNYLLGKNPPAFDLLYWNSDSTNLPGPMLCWYLRNLYLENRLKKSGDLKVAGNPVDLGKIDAPCFIYGSREDHIVPWSSAYQSSVLLNPKKPKQNQFILGASGHIAGVINPPQKNKRSYWSHPHLESSAEEWFNQAEEHAGSWWPEWVDFMAQQSGKLLKAPTKLGSAAYAVIESAPGSYVKVRAD
jgi:polyhydroxyalkanoate synthase